MHRGIRRLVAGTACLLAATTLSACGGSGSSGDTGKVTVVTSTDVWGSVATAVAGGDAEVSSIIKDPNADPHSYESSPSDAAAVTDAGLVVLNGGGYDTFMEKALDGKSAVNAYDLRQDKNDENEHVWYDTATVDTVAQQIATRLGDLDPDHRADYTRRATDFGRQLTGIREITAKIAAEHPRSPVAQTEPIAHYLLVAAGADDRTPPDFEHAIEDGTDPAPATLAATRDLFSDKQVRVLVYNIQTADKVTQDVRAAAEAAGVPIVEVTETLPAGQDYIQWQTHTAQALADALR